MAQSKRTAMREALGKYLRNADASRIGIRDCLVAKVVKKDKNKA